MCRVFPPDSAVIKAGNLQQLTSFPPAALYANRARYIQRNPPNPAHCDYSDIIGGPVTHQLLADIDGNCCTCSICKLVKSNTIFPGRTKESTPQPKMSVICKVCGSIYGLGHAHKCNPKLELELEEDPSN